ncbi:G-patch domain [Musa troglodytarum]|uniref:G-patch domain n=1 Tax=Musa troglodytarum TaxID=320322 RepID=A0A9E7JC27_9LILI|nr:G-patch domain [Musa troglodytarum]
MGGRRQRFGRNGGRGHPRGSGSAVLFSDHAGISERPRGRGDGAKKDGNRPMPARGNAFGYAYPAGDIAGGRDDTSRPILLACSENSQPLEVFVDPTRV